jgi:hypothetical protein
MQNDSLEVIYVYTRAQAIEDRVLIDVSELAHKVGFKCPVAITAAVYADCVAWLSWPNCATCLDLTAAPDGLGRSQGGPLEGEDETEQGRLWDVLNRCIYAARGSDDQDSTLFFAVWRIPYKGEVPEYVRLKSVLHSGDNGEMVLTIMEPLED